MQRVALWFGPLAGLLVSLALHQQDFTSAQIWTAGITTLVALWWVFEPIAIPATSLIPLAVFPLVGVLKAEQVAAAYGDKMILLLTGGLMLSSAMERSGTHRRIALGMVSLFGASSGRRLVLGFMSAAVLLSMWISNAATTLMLFPIVLAVVERSSSQRLSQALLLGIAYGATIGGVGTPVGTPPNLIFMQHYSRLTGAEVGFIEWMSWTLPIVLVMLPLTWLWLTRNLGQLEPIVLPATGAWRREEILTLSVFALTALLWITRTEPWGGWSGLCGTPQANDASVALLAVVAMFLIPNGKGQKLLDWSTATKIPWGVLLLFSSGIVVAEAFDQSGLSLLISEQLTGMKNLSLFAMVLLICFLITFLSEITSNTALASLMMPILAATATAAEIDPRRLMVPGALAASLAFMLPVGTAPNAIVFSSDKISSGVMAREGFVLNLMAIAVTTVLCTWLFA